MLGPGNIPQKGILQMRQLSQQVGQSTSFVYNVWVACSNSILIECNFTMHFNQVYFTQRVTFCEWIRHKVTSEPDFLSNIFFSDEAHFWLNGYVNSQNYRI